VPRRTAYDDQGRLIPWHETYSPPQGPKRRWWLLYLPAAIAVAAFAVANDQQDVIPNMPTMVKVKQTPNGTTLEGCFKLKNSTAIGTLAMTVPETDKMRFDWINYDTGEHKTLGSLADVEVQEYPAVYTSPHNETPLRCNSAVANPGGLPHHPVINGQLFQETNNNAIVDKLTGPYSDNTTMTGGNFTTVPDVGTVEVATYSVGP